MYRITISLVLLLYSFSIIGQQSNPTSTIEALKDKADQLWLDKSFIQLKSVLDEMKTLTDQSNDPNQKIEMLVMLHEYEAFHTLDNGKALEYIVNAIELADRHAPNELQLYTRSKLIYFQQTTTHNQESVSREVQEMMEINKSLQSEFYSMVSQQWQAHVVGSKRLMGLPVSEVKINAATATLKESLDYFDASNPDHLFYYLQARRCVLAFFPDKFDEPRVLSYLEKTYEISPLLKDPISVMGNLTIEAAYYVMTEQWRKLVDTLESKVHLLENSNAGLSSFYYQFLQAGYVYLGEYKKALEASNKVRLFDQMVNESAFNNKIESIIISNEKQRTQLTNENLTKQNTYTKGIAALAALGLLTMIWVYRKIKTQNSIIEQQKKNLEQVNASKNKLFGILAHDLRAPLSSFNNIGQKINYLASKKDYDGINAMLNQIENKTSNLEGILQNILPWMSLQIKNPNLKLSAEQLSPIIQEMCDHVSPMAIAKDIKIDLDVDFDAIALIDNNALKIVLRNILNNAIKFTHTGGTISIATSKTDQNGWNITIKDNGIGMAEHRLNNIFKDYQSKQGTEGETGYGLGLKLSYDLMTSMEGDIDVQSEVDQGTMFELILKAA